MRMDKILFLTVLWLGTLSSLLRAQDLPGYDYDPFSKSGDFNCHRKEYSSPISASIDLNKPLQVQVCLSKDFSPSSENILRQSFDVFVERVINKDVYGCAYETTLSASELNAKYTQFVKAKVHEAFEARMPDLASVYPRYLFISNLKPADPETYSAGYRNYYYSPYKNWGDWSKTISIAIRGDLIGSLDFGFGEDTNFWAAIIVPAFMSNMGIRDDLTTHDGIFVNRLSQCVYFDGKIPEVHRKQLPKYKKQEPIAD